MQFFILQIFWHLYKDIVIQQSIFVAAKKLLIKGKRPALLTIDFEILHLLTSFLELLCILDVDHG